MRRSTRSRIWSPAGTIPSRSRPMTACFASCWKPCSPSSPGLRHVSLMQGTQGLWQPCAPAARAGARRAIRIARPAQFLLGARRLSARAPAGPGLALYNLPPGADPGRFIGERTQPDRRNRHLCRLHASPGFSAAVSRRRTPGFAGRRCRNHRARVRLGGWCPIGAQRGLQPCQRRRLCHGEYLARHR